MTLGIPHSRQRFEEIFWKDLSFEPGWDEAFVKPERPAPAEVHTSGWTQTVSEAADFFGIEESHVPCLVMLSMGERHGTFVPIDKSFGVYNFLKQIKERMPSAPGSLAALLDKRQHLRQIAQHRLGLDPAQVQSLSRKLTEAEVLAPELIADCRARLETLTQAEPSDMDLRTLRAVSDLLPPSDRPSGTTCASAGSPTDWTA
ncbi:hypothetical protein ACWGJ0_23530 [Streptomyces massasporeus]